jgi:hypothetical protein
MAGAAKALVHGALHSTAQRGTAQRSASIPQVLKQSYTASSNGAWQGLHNNSLSSAIANLTALALLMGAGADAHGRCVAPHASVRHMCTPAQTDMSSTLQALHPL